MGNGITAPKKLIIGGWGQHQFHLQISLCICIDLIVTRAWQYLVMYAIVVAEAWVIVQNKILAIVLNDVYLVRKP